MTWENESITADLIAARDRKAHEFLSHALFVLDGTAGRLVAAGRDAAAAQREDLAARVKEIATEIAGLLPKIAPAAETGGDRG